MVDNKRIGEVFNTYLRPQTFPLAIRMCESRDELPEKVKVPQKDMGITISVCHAIRGSLRRCLLPPSGSPRRASLPGAAP